MPNYNSRLDEAFRALADPTRRLMVERLCQGPATVSELARPLAMALPSVMQHLQVLESSGLVRTQKAGRVRTCLIEAAALQDVERWVSARRMGWEKAFDRLALVLADDTDNQDHPT
jgi:DNA-binding transcriptional ArsR family regulator